MPKLSWNDVGKRLFQSGVDRGVLYVGSNVGVPWNGLISVSESSSGGEAKPYYLDGIKVHNEANREEFEATIQAFTYPSEFEACDGTYSIEPGLFIEQQPRIPFNLSYRTLIGNDVKATDYGFKIHLIYNALVSPSESEFTTLTDEPEAMTFSWGITTTPIEVPGFIHSAHLVIDSTRTRRAVLRAVQDILYGTDIIEPRMPTPQELINIFVETSDAGGFSSTFGVTF